MNEGYTCDFIVMSIEKDNNFPCGDGYLTEGKIYHLKNGYFKDDMNYIYPRDTLIEDFNQLIKYFDGKPNGKKYLFYTEVEIAEIKEVF